ncbi:acyltransferase family protein [Hymenobacter lucidus]|uniref:Acyltransferase n=1 Tax=Hymenobacter lucidus TaxID=2880930 RepID=A0ABS8AT28_9BACT|nr:acyltransferase [Hymenobacter lucidus]MCB2408511.1 acyltransferase [Hymenobacter lucidus]
MIRKNNQAIAGAYYPALTGIRAIAAYLVFFVHYNPFDSLSNRNSFYRFLHDVCSHFHIGVSIFFVLSGFLITVRYQNGVELSKAWIKKYLRNRVARIYPMYFLITVLTVVASQLTIAYDPSGLWKFYNLKDKIWVAFLNLTFLRGFFDRYHLSIVGQGWTLTVEECFYLSAPLLLLGIRRQWWRVLVYPLALLGIGLVLATIGTRFHNQFFGFFGSVKFMLNWTFFGRCLEFFAGMTLALLISYRKAEAQSSRGFVTAVGFACVLLVLYALVVIERNVPRDLMGTDLFSVSAIIVRNAVLPVGIATLFWGLLYEQTWFKKILETKLLDLLGRSSYAFYLLHGGILNVFMNQFLYNNIFLKFLTTIIVSVAAYLWVEHPIHKLLTSNSRQKGSMKD